jgi:hypothetical protein
MAPVSRRPNTRCMLSEPPVALVWTPKSSDGSREKNCSVPPRFEVEAVDSEPAPWASSTLPMSSLVMARLMCRPL